MTAPFIPPEWRDEILLAREIPGLGICGVQRLFCTCGLLVNLRFDGLSYDYDRRY